MTYLDDTLRIKKFGGEIWYVNKGAGDDANGGQTPDDAFETIGHGISSAAAGDAVSVRAGTYTETGLDLNKNAMELWFEIGAIIDPISGTALTISGNFCLIEGMHQITPAAGEIGLLISGSNCHVEHGMVMMGGTGIRVTGAATMINNYACGLQTAIAYDLQVDQCRLYQCKTVGNAATIGFSISNGADTGVLQECTSTGHATAGFYIYTGSENWTLLNCSSGGNDGRWVDADSANVWSNFSFDDQAFHALTFDGDGGANRDLFKITGTVLITELSGHVETVLSNDVGNGYLELDDGTVQIDVTDSPGPAFNSLPVGTYAHKIDDAGVQIAIEDASQVRLYEDATKDGRDPNFQVTAKYGVDTFIRLVYSGVATSGVLHWHCKWEPLADDGFVEAV